MLNDNSMYIWTDDGKMEIIAECANVKISVLDPDGFETTDGSLLIIYNSDVKFHSNKTKFKNLHLSPIQDVLDLRKWKHIVLPSGDLFHMEQTTNSLIFRVV